MTQIVNINGQELELEQCVIDGIELDDPKDELDDNYVPDLVYIPNSFPEGKEFENLDKLDIVEVPEDEQFIKEYIESDLDSQIDDQVFDKLLEDLDKDPEVMPSCHTFVTWLQHNGYVDLIHRYEDYIKEYRRELREWWMTKSKRYVTNDKGELLMSNGIPITKDDIEASDKVKEIISNSINKSIDKEIIS